MLRWVVAPVVAGLTYRRAVHLLLGAVLLLPYLGLGALFVAAAGEPAADPVSLVLLLGVALVAAVGVALVPGVRTLEITAARALLGAEVPDPDPATVDAWPARRRAGLWLVVNLLAGGLTAVVVLVVVPSTIGLLFAPWREVAPLPPGWASAWAPVAGLLLPVVLLHAVSATGGALARLAPRLLGPSEAERLAVALDRARAAERAAAERNRLARELHDSVGHALTVTTLQAGAAARLLDTDPAFVARALDAIADAGRTALDELDHVLGLLRDGTPGDRRPAPDLADLDGLLDGTRSAGVPVTAAVTGATGAVPPVVSREAYRIVQEGLTNALRHAGPVPVDVRVEVGADRLDLTLTNPLGSASGRGGGGGRGLAGMRERVGALGGELTAGPTSGPTAGHWRVAVRLPLPATTPATPAPADPT